MSEETKFENQLCKEKEYQKEYQKEYIIILILGLLVVNYVQNVVLKIKKLNVYL